MPFLPLYTLRSKIVPKLASASNRSSQYPYFKSKVNRTVQLKNSKYASTKKHKTIRIYTCKALAENSTLGLARGIAVH